MNRKVLELVSFITVNLVEHPEAVVVETEERDGEEIFRVRVHPDDRGRLLGREGRTARAVRTLLQAVSARDDRRYMLEIADGE